MTLQHDARTRTPVSIEVMDVHDLIDALTATPLDAPQADPPQDRGLRLLQSHQRQRDIRRTAIGWRS